MTHFIYSMNSGPSAYFSSLAIYITVSGHSVSFMRGMICSYKACHFHGDATHSYMYVIQDTATHCNTLQHNIREATH